MSSAGNGAGLAGERSGLWREFARIVGELEPRWVVVENVASGASRWFDTVVCDLEQRGYDVLPIPLSASDVGAPHERSRVFIVAHAKCVRRKTLRAPVGEAGHPNGNGKPTLALDEKVAELRGLAENTSTWATLPAVRSMDDGISEGLVLDEQKKNRPSEALWALRGTNKPASLQWQTRRPNPLQASQVLQSDVYGVRADERESNTGRSQKARQAPKGRQVPKMRGNTEAAVASHRSRLVERLQREPGDPLRHLSHEGPSYGWGYPPTKEEIAAYPATSRAHRLRSLGNAVVPQCAVVVGWIIRELEDQMNAKNPSPAEAGEG